MKTILVIEDDNPIRESIVEVLTLEGFNVLEAGDGAAGVQLAAEKWPDLIICDVTMPHLSGYDVLLKLREANRKAITPFLFLTARTDRSFVRHGMELGADDYLTKPCTDAELVAAVRAQLDKYSQVASIYLQEWEQTRKHLAQLITHELRTPLVSLITTQDLIARQVGHLSVEELNELLQSLRFGSQRLRHVVDQIVFTTQVETETLVWENIVHSDFSMQLWEIVTVAINMARTYAYRNREGFVSLKERDRTARVRCQVDALKHTLAELISNALNFSPEGKSIVISQWRADGRVWLSITDEGPGIPSDQIERAMTNFQQIDRNYFEQQGLGLGLPLARRIVEIHQGTFHLASVVGKGTQLTLSFPLYPNDDSADGY